MLSKLTDDLFLGCWKSVAAKSLFSANWSKVKSSPCENCRLFTSFMGLVESCIVVKASPSYID